MANVDTSNLSEDSLKVMKDIDGAVLLDRRTHTIQTKFGVTHLKHLPTGCKTILNYIWMYENKEVYPKLRAIYVTECGVNALEKLFSLAERYKDSDTIFVLEHEDNVEDCNDREYIVDGERHITSMFEF